MRILYVATVGGFMTFFKTLVKELINAGNVVDFAANQTTSKVPDYYKEWGCKVYNISCSRSPLSFGNIKAIKEIRNIAKNYDVVHCHTPLAGVATRFACKTLRKKQNLRVIYTAHGFHFYKGAPKKNWLFYYPIEKLCSKWTDMLITINKEDYDFAKKKLVAKRIEYVPGVGIDVGSFANVVVNKKQKRNELNIPEDAFLAISVGELNNNKNHEVVIRAISEIKDPDIHYLIAGMGKKKNELEKLAKDFGVKLHLVGFRNDIAELYGISDVCIFPSIREGFGLAAIEGMAAGLPLICSNNRGTREYAFDGAIVCNSVCEFKDAIIRVKTDPCASKAMGEYNASFVKKFDCAGINAVMERIYKEATDE